MRQLDEVSLRLLKAAEVIRKHGWCQRTPRNRAGQVCALGAIWALDLDGAGMSNPMAAAAARRLRAFVGESVPIWNDAPERTAADVIRALEAAAFGVSPVAQTDNRSAT